MPRSSVDAYSKAAKLSNRMGPPHDYDAATDTFKPGTLASHPPQGNDAKCGFACHTSVKARDYVFTEYGHR